jgi:hypothetical protein
LRGGRGATAGTTLGKGIATSDTRFAAGAVTGEVRVITAVVTPAAAKSPTPARIETSITLGPRDLGGGG